MISNPDPHPTALVLSVYVPYSDINPDTGLPKGTLFLPPLPSGFPRKKTALPPNGVLHNPDTRDLGGAELRIPLGTGTTPTLFTQPCTSVGDIIVPPLDFSNG